jgi:ribosomal protein S18 acetylase RimI-like enzyme
MGVALRCDSTGLRSTGPLWPVTDPRAEFMAAGSLLGPRTGGQIHSRTGGPEAGRATLVITGPAASAPDLVGLADMTIQRAEPFTIIRRLPVERWAEYRELRLRALKSAPQAFGQSYEAATAQPEEHWQKRLADVVAGNNWLVFAEHEGRLIGVTGAFQWPEDIAANRATVVAVYVDEDQRGLGIGSALMQATLDELRGHVATAILAVNPAQTAAVRLYERMGFSPIGTEVNLMGDGAECEEIVMELSLR